MTATPASSVGSPWRSRDFRLVWAGGFVNDLGDWLLIIALPVYVFSTTSSGTTTALLFLVQMAPTALLGSIAGTFVDRWDLRRTIIVTNVAQAVTLLPLLAVRHDRVWPAFVVAGTQAVLTRFNNPAVGSLIPRLVGADQLGAANAATAVANNLSRLAGSPLGGLVVEFGGLRTVVLVDGITFLVVAVAAWRVTPSVGRPDTANAASRAGGVDLSAGANHSGEAARGRGLRDGLAVIRRTRPLPALLAVATLTQFAQGLFLVLFIGFVVRHLDGSGSEVGLLRGVQAVGGVMGGVVVGRFATRIEPARLLGWGFIAMGLIAAATWNAASLTTSMWCFVPAFMIVGIPAVAGGIGALTTMQIVSPPEVLGRVIGTMEAAAAIGTAAGVAVAGITIDSVGILPMLDVQAATYVIAGTIGLAVVARGVPPSRQRPITAGLTTELDDLTADSPDDLAGD